MAQRSKRPLTRGTAITCALLDAAAFRLDLGAAAGRQSLIRGPMAITARALSKILRYWNTCWVGRYLGLAWVISTFRHGKAVPPKQPLPVHVESTSVRPWPTSDNNRPVTLDS